MLRVITDYLDRTAEKYPDKIAFADETSRITFKDLRKTAKKIARQIISMGIENAPVAIYMSKNISCICSMLGTLYSGNYYAVLDVDSPYEHNEKILGILNPRLMIVEKQDLKPKLQNCGILSYDYLPEMNVQYICERKVCSSENDIFSVCFTSGSSGISKGVAHTHRSLIACMEEMADVFGYGQDTVFASQFPFTSAGSTEDIFITIMQGCTTYLIPQKLFLQPYRIADYIYENNVNAIYWVSSALKLLAQYKVFESNKMSGLKIIKACGEILPVSTANTIIDAIPDVQLFNQLGSTEIYCATYYKICLKRDETDRIPIGVPYRTVETIIADENGNEASEGELYIRSPFIAASYYNSAELTNEAFVQNPLHDIYRDIVFRTGDIVKIDKEGMINYVGRRDFQVKKHGRRIELEEIESAAMTVEGIGEGGCVYDRENELIYLLYSGELAEEEVAEGLKKVLPNYMLPDRFIKASIPHNKTGKIDRVLLATYLKDKARKGK